MQLELLETIKKFNKNGKLESLISIFTENFKVSKELISFLNLKLNNKRLIFLKFSVVKISDKFIVYITSDGKIVSVENTIGSLRNILNEIKKIDINSKNKISTIDIRNALLVLGKGSLKSYDVYTNINTDLISKLEIKKAILNQKFWIKDRVKLQNNLIKCYLKNTKYLANKIEGSSSLEKALYCTRGTIASGKSTFLTNYLHKNIHELKDTNGVINTDRIKNILIERTENLSGLCITGYVFHEEASLLNEMIVIEANRRKLIYCVDKRMHEEDDLKKIIAGTKNRKLPIIIFDFHVDFITSTLRILARQGIYPDDPISDFRTLFKSYEKNEEGRYSFIKESLNSTEVKNYYKVNYGEKGEPNLIALKKDFKTIEHLDINFAQCTDEKNYKNILVSSDKTLEEALNEHSQNVYKDKNSKEDYLVKFLENIKNTSRSYNGEINVTASSDKKLKMNTGLSVDLTKNKVRENLNEAFDFVYNNKNIILINSAVLKTFINRVAIIVNRDLILNEKDLIRGGKNSTKYNYVSIKNVEKFYDNFVENLYLKILDISTDRIEIAAWVEWNIDFSGHIFSDGCGRVAKLISSWILIRSNKDLPNYLLRQDNFNSTRASYRKRYTIREEINYSKPSDDNNYIQFLHYYKKLFNYDKKHEKILASGGLIYNNKGEFLILQTSKGKDTGKWVIPGGKLEVNEAPIEAFRREVFEETNLKVDNIILIGSRDYTAVSGNRYHFYEYIAKVKNKSKIIINKESLSFKWIKEEQINNIIFTDSVRNFLNKYFIEHLSSYYKVFEEIDCNNFDVPSFKKHTMHSNLRKYIKTKLPSEALKKLIPFVKKFELHGIYPDLKLISELNLNFKIIEVISKNTPKKNNSNNVRPIFFLAEKNYEKILVCCAVPGRDHILHYASMISFFIKDFNIKLSVFVYPFAERKIDKWTGLDAIMICKNDTVILGYSTYFKELFLKKKNFSLLTVSQNKFYTSTRFLCPSGNIVNCLESNYGPWGNICDFLTHKICQLGANEIIHTGKVGTLSSPIETYRRIYIPASFVIARRDEVFCSDASIKNSMEYIEQHSSLAHVSVTTTMEETFKQRKLFENHLIETIDMESSKIAQSIALYNLRSDKKVKFGAIHFSSDYLRKENEEDLCLDFDLTTDRKIFKSKKDIILNEIFEIIKKHL